MNEQHAEDTVERRVELAIKVALLEERSVQTKDHLDRIERMITNHAVAEEDIMRDMVNGIADIKSHFETKLDTVVAPIQTELTKYKTVIGVVSVFIIAIWTVVSTFKEHIFRWFAGS